jgi:hypothetical protein
MTWAEPAAGHNLPGIKALQRRLAARDRRPGGRSSNVGRMNTRRRGVTKKTEIPTVGSAHPRSGAALRS